MILSKAPAEYSATNEQQVRQELQLADNQNVKKGTSIYMRAGTSIFLSSPDGALWSISVDNAGVLSAVAVP